MKPPTLQRGVDRVDGMTSMVDVVFLLLIFFVWSSSFDTPERRIETPPVQPAVASGADVRGDIQPIDFDEVVIGIESTGDHSYRYRINQLDLGGWAELQERLNRLKAIGIGFPIIVDPAERVPVQEVVRVYDSARRGFTGDVMLAVPDPDAAP